MTVVNANQAAEDCVDCDNSLQVRISVHDILNRVERVTRSVHERGDVDSSVNLDENPEGIFEPFMAQLDAVTQVEFHQLDARLGVTKPMGRTVGTS